MSEAYAGFLAGAAVASLVWIALIASALWWAIREEKRHKSMMQEREY